MGASLNYRYDASTSSGVGGSIRYKTSVNSAVNNSSFNAGTTGSIRQKAIDSITESSLQDAFSTIAPSNRYVKVASELYNLFDLIRNASEGDVLTVDSTMKGAIDNARVFVKQSENLEDVLTRQQDAISTPLPGETLPSVLTSNTKSLVSSINTLTSTFSDKFDYFNNYVYGILTYMDSMVGFMDKAYTLAKDQADYEKKKEEDNMIDVNGTKMSPAEIEAKKNYSMWQAYSFQTSPIDQSTLEATEVMGMTPLQIQASKYSYDVESSVYNMTPTTVKDWDDNILADISPREAQHVKNSVVAINQTDEKNVELDDDDVDIMSPIDVSAMFGLPDLTQPFKVVMDEMTR